MSEELKGWQEWLSSFKSKAPKSWDIKSIIIYIVIILILLFAFKAERADINCSDTKGTSCGDGKGRAYYGSHPEDGDSKKVLLDKLVKTAKFDFTTVHWRRCMIVSIISAFIIIAIVQKKLPDAQLFAVSVIVIFLISYGAKMNFQSAIATPATKQVDLIASKMNL